MPQHFIQYKVGSVYHKVTHYCNTFSSDIFIIRSSWDPKVFSHSYYILYSTSRMWEQLFIRPSSLLKIGTMILLLFSSSLLVLLLCEQIYCYAFLRLQKDIGERVRTATELYVHILVYALIPYIL